MELGKFQSLRNLYFSHHLNLTHDMQVSTVYRAALLQLSVNPLFARASIHTSLTVASQTQNTRLYSILFPQCPPTYKTTYTNPASQIRTMSDFTSSDSTATANTATQGSSTDSADQSQTEPTKVSEQKYLPASASSDNVQGSNSGGIKLDMSTGGTEMKLDHLGPMVVNTDGTLSQIGNWQQMSEIEKKNTLRIISKRNKSRLAALKAKGEGNVPESASSGSSEGGNKLGMNTGGIDMKLDQLGPMVANTHGPSSQIENRQHMSVIEKKNALPFIEKRNKSRSEALKAKVEDIKK
jgi:hypothetical protein